MYKVGEKIVVDYVAMRMTHMPNIYGHIIWLDSHGWVHACGRSWFKEEVRYPTQEEIEKYCI